VQRSDIVDYATYNDTRDQTRPAALAAKAVRRIHLHEHLTFLFENRSTLCYQIQEIMRVERLVRAADIDHEIATYNAMLGNAGDVACALLIEITDRAERTRLLSEWVGLPAHVYVVLGDGTRVYAEYDSAQVGETRLSAVQYLRFPVRGRAPVAIGTDFHVLECEVDLTAAQIAALSEDVAQ